MKILRITAIVTLASIFLIACSDRSEPPKEHVFQGQVDALDKAKQLESQMSDAEKERRKKIEQQF